MRERNFKVLQQQAYDYIKDLIMNQTLEYNNIYSESKLALEIGVSRTPVRDAVHRLYQEGYIDIVPNKGFVLHKMTQNDVIETFEVRSAIESYCCRKIAEENQTNPAKELLNELKISLDKLQAIFNSTKDVAEFTAEDQHFHYLLVSYGNNTAFLDIFNQYTYKIQKLIIHSLQYKDRMLHALEEHQVILQALHEGNGQKACEAAIQHMKAPMKINMEIIYDK